MSPLPNLRPEIWLITSGTVLEGFQKINFNHMAEIKYHWHVSIRSGGTVQASLRRNGKSNKVQNKYGRTHFNKTGLYEERARQVYY